MTTEIGVAGPRDSAKEVHGSIAGNRWVQLLSLIHIYLLLHPDNVISVAPQANEDWVMEIRRQNYAVTEIACDVIREVYTDFEKTFGRKYGNPFFEEYMTEDADVVLLGMGTMSTPVKVAVRKLREEGKKVGFVRLRWFRPFPGPDLAKCLGRFKAVGVIDRDFSFGSPDLSGVVATEVRSAMYSSCLLYTSRCV